MNSPAPAGFLSYGYLDHRRHHVCPDCGLEHVNTVGNGHRCPECAEKNRAAVRREANRNWWRRKRAKHVIAEVIG